MKSTLRHFIFFALIAAIYFSINLNVFSQEIDSNQIVSEPIPTGITPTPPPPTTPAPPPPPPAPATAIVAPAPVPATAAPAPAAASAKAAFSAPATQNIATSNQGDIKTTDAGPNYGEAQSVLEVHLKKNSGQDTKANDSTATLQISAPTPPPTPTPTPTPPLPQLIVIETLVVEVGENFNKEIGVKYGYIRDKVLHPDSSLKGMDFNFATDQSTSVYVPRFNSTDNNTYTVPLDSASQSSPGLDVQLGGISVGDGNLKAALKAFIQTGDAELRSQPIAVALEGTQTHIQTVDEIPFQDVKFTGSRLTPILDVTFEKVGITLTVTPSIEGADKDKVRLKITKIEVSQVTKYLKEKNISRPIVAKTEANTEVIIKNRETIVLGGLKSERETDSEEKLPILGSIPVLGYFFRHKKISTEKTDIYFFITPTILETGQDPLFPKDFKHKEDADKIIYK